MQRNFDAAIAKAKLQTYEISQETIEANKGFEASGTGLAKPPRRQLLLLSLRLETVALRSAVLVDMFVCVRGFGGRSHRSLREEVCRRRSRHHFTSSSAKSPHLCNLSC
jgi:hypothetical protein